MLNKWIRTSAWAFAKLEPRSDLAWQHHALETFERRRLEGRRLNVMFAFLQGSGSSRAGI